MFILSFIEVASETRGCTPLENHLEPGRSGPSISVVIQTASALGVEVSLTDNVFFKQYSERCLRVKKFLIGSFPERRVTYVAISWRNPASCVHCQQILHLIGSSSNHFLLGVHSQFFIAMLCRHHYTEQRRPNVAAIIGTTLAGSCRMET